MSDKPKTIEEIVNVTVGEMRAMSWLQTVLSDKGNSDKLAFDAHGAISKIISALLELHKINADLVSQHTTAIEINKAMADMLIHTFIQRGSPILEDLNTVLAASDKEWN